MIIAEKDGIRATFPVSSWEMLKDKRGWVEVKQIKSVKLPPEVDSLMRAKEIKKEPTKDEMIAELVAKGVAIDKRWSVTKLKEVLNDIREQENRTED